MFVSAELWQGHCIMLAGQDRDMQQREAAAPTASLQGPRLLHYGGRYAYLAPVPDPALCVTFTHAIIAGVGGVLVKDQKGQHTRGT